MQSKVMVNLGYFLINIYDHFSVWSSVHSRASQEMCPLNAWYGNIQGTTQQLSLPNVMLECGYFRWKWVSFLFYLLLSWEHSRTSLKMIPQNDSIEFLINQNHVPW